jgi:hypothetical protein
MEPAAEDARLERLREHRNRPDRDLSLAFLVKQFKRDVERPHKQLAQIAELWRDMVPPDLVEHCRLDGLARGVLRVSVDSSPHLYQLDQLLRGGLQHQLIRAHTGPALRRIKLSMATLD